MQPQILFASIDNCCFFKLRGELRYTNAAGMDELIEQLFSKPASCNQVIIDLNEATFLDSTHVGLLASLARYCQQQQLPKPTLFSTRPQINELLYSLCLDQAFQIVEKPTSADVKLSGVTAASYSEQQQGEMILRAHQALIALNDKNKAEFQPLVDLLQQQLTSR
ncbi:STAS domain-containing protein [Arsukibacterium sp.]|uniref:STAS domain-containing protein n=1 Tax=Arsukibacterium sp. TaxID=1977258 RepID=UPI00299E8669|nr:STAS domain-containing protein [Arsukibacterium sp.]MDX1677559.1 STAS domain-containing protein [Arsukibacterium sp.]